MVYVDTHSLESAFVLLLNSLDMIYLFLIVAEGGRIWGVRNPFVLALLKFTRSEDMKFDSFLTNC